MDLPQSQGATTILVVVDPLTKMVHSVPSAGLPLAQETADLVLRELFHLHGLPQRRVSDRGPQLTLHFWWVLLKGLGVQLHLSAYHPQSDGQTEHINEILEQYLQCFVNFHQDNWISLLAAEFSSNNALHTLTFLSPFFANYGFHPCFFSLPSSPSTLRWQIRFCRSCEPSTRFFASSSNGQWMITSISLTNISRLVGGPWLGLALHPAYAHPEPFMETEAPVPRSLSCEGCDQPDGLPGQAPSFLQCTFGFPPRLAHPYGPCQCAPTGCSPSVAHPGGRGTRV